MSTVMFILDIVVICTLFLTLLFGLFRGFHRTVNKIIVFLIPTVLLLIVVKPISNKIVETKVEVPNIILEQLPLEVSEQLSGDEHSVRDVVTIIVAENVYPNDENLKNDSELAVLVSSFVEIVVMIGVYIGGIVLVYIMKGILSLIFLIIRSIFGIKLKRKAHLLGMVAGVVNFIIVFILIYLPIYGSLSLVADVVQQIDQYQEQLELNDSNLEPLREVSDAVENSFVKKVFFKPATKVFCKDKTITFDAQYIGNSLTIETDHGSIKVYEEYKQIKDALPTAMKIIDVMMAHNNHEQQIIDMSQFTESDIEQLSNLIENSNLIRVALPAAIEISVYTLQQKNSEYVDILQKLKSINWDQELTNLAALIDVLKDHRELTIDTSNFERVLLSQGFIDLLKDLTNKTFELEIVTDILLPTAIIVLYDSLELSEIETEYDIDFDEIKNINWNVDGPSLMTVIFNIYEIYLDIDIEFSDWKVAFNNLQLPQAIDNVTNELKNSIIITDTILPITIEYLAAKLKNEQAIDIDIEALKAIDWKVNLPQIGTALKEVIEAYQTLEIDPENFKDVLKNPMLQTELDSVITEILEVEVIRDYILPIVMVQICDELAKKEQLKDFEINFDNLKKADWKTELVNVKNTFIAFLNGYQALEVDLKNWTEILDDENLVQYVNDMMDEALKSTILKEELLPSFANKLNKTLSEFEELDLSFLENIVTKDNIVKLLTDDIDELIIIMKDLRTMGLLEDGTKKIDYQDVVIQDALVNMVKTIFTLSVVEGNEATIFDGVLTMASFKEQLVEYGVEFNYDNVQNWEQEIDQLCGIFKNVMMLTGKFDSFEIDQLFKVFESDEDKVIIAEIVEGFAKSSIFGDSIYNVINHLIESYSPDYVLTFTDEDKKVIEEENGWKKEIITLLDILEDIKLIIVNGDYKALEAEPLKTIMLEAANGVIASKVLGIELNIIFDGVIDEDFTNRETLKSNAQLVYDAITLSQILDNPDFDLNDESQVETLVSTINNLSQNEEQLQLANQFINEIIEPTEELKLSTEEIQEASTIVEDVIKAYQNSSNQETFTYEELTEEQRNAIENNEFASLVLDYFFG